MPLNILKEFNSTTKLVLEFRSSHDYWKGEGNYDLQFQFLLILQENWSILHSINP
jgi:hypothetical protein